MIKKIDKIFLRLPRKEEMIDDLTQKRYQN